MSADELSFAFDLDSWATSVQRTLTLRNPQVNNLVKLFQTHQQASLLPWNRCLTIFIIGLHQPQCCCNLAKTLPLHVSCTCKRWYKQPTAPHTKHYNRIQPNHHLYTTNLTQPCSTQPNPTPTQ